jgi:hypothetical protein
MIRVRVLLKQEVIIIKRLTIILLVAVLLAVTTVNVFGANEEKIKLLSENIVSGGPPPDGIPPIENPKYISIEEADDFLEAEDAVFVAELEAGIYVFPQSIMVWHEIVNEEINGEKLSITYCPLTGSAIGYYGDLAAGSSDFGTSGKLVNSNLIMYDRQTESYWSQILGQAISGPLTGEKLDRFQLTWTSWSNIKAKYEKANILSNKTGFSRDYTSDPYGSYRSDQSGNYYRNDNLYFNVLSSDDSLDKKDVVIAGEYKGEHFAVEKELVIREKELNFKIDDHQLIATYEPELNTVRIRKDDEELVVYDVMWFGWHAFYPEFSENLIKSP